MPGYRGHLVGGVIAFGLLLYALKHLHPTPFMAAEWLACSLAGSLFPDIDVKSKGQKLFYWLILILFMLLFYHGRTKVIVGLSFAAVTPMLVRHRGIFHRLWFVIAIPFATAWYLGILYPVYARKALFDAGFFCVGVLSHLWLDLGLRRMFRL